MKHILNGRSLLCAVTLAALGACSVESPWHGNDGEGSISLDLSASKKVTAAVPAVRAISTEIVTPPVADFKIKVSKTDGSYSETFSTVADFVSRDKYSVGTYEIEAWYGEPDSQGYVADEDEGYENAYYYGKMEGIIVNEGKTTEVSMGASLANSIIVIEYSDAFKKYFAEWSTTLQTDGNTPVEIGNGEGESYVVPGNVNVVISGTLGNGKTLRLNPAQFSAEAGHMYKMRYNIYNGEVGEVDKLVIEFDENLTTDPVVIDLSEELENTPVPEVTPEGFTNGQSFVCQAGFPFEGEMKFNVKALAGIEKAVLTITAKSATDNSELNDLNLNWLEKVQDIEGYSVDLCAMNDSQRAAMEDDGVKAMGFSRNPGEMAQLDLTDLISKLGSGIYTFNLQVKDKLQQVNEAVSAKITRFPVKMEMEAEPVAFGTYEAYIHVRYNGPDPTEAGNDPFDFYIINDQGVEESVERLSITKIEDTRSYESHEYVYRLSLVDVDRDEHIIHAYFGGKTQQSTPDVIVKAPIEYPDYKVEIDPMTRKLRIRATTENGELDYLIAQKLKVYVNGECVSNKGEEEFLRDFPDPNDNPLIVYNLEPEKDYHVQTTLSCVVKNPKFGSDDNVRTTHELEVPNGKFQDKNTTINTTLQAGGKYRVSPVDYTLSCPFKYDEASGWASLNQKTFYLGSKTQNSWFMVASTYLEGNEAVIRTVGYSHDGTVPKTSGGAFNTKYYCENAPDEDKFEKCSGEMFLGSYSYDGREIRTEGIDFDTRPTSFTFDYTYSPVDKSSSVRGYYEISLFSENDTELVSADGILVPQSTLQTVTVNFDRYPFGIKAKKLKIKFMSSDPSRKNSLLIKIPTGSELNEGTGLGNKTLSQNSTKAVAIGSVLRISNLQFHYGEHQNNN